MIAGFRCFGTTHLSERQPKEGKLCGNQGRFLLQGFEAWNQTAEFEFLEKTFCRIKIQVTGACPFQVKGDWNVGANACQITAKVSRLAPLLQQCAQAWGNSFKCV